MQFGLGWLGYLGLGAGIPNEKSAHVLFALNVNFFPRNKMLQHATAQFLMGDSFAPTPQ